MEENSILVLGQLRKTNLNNKIFKYTLLQSNKVPLRIQDWDFVLILHKGDAVNKIRE
jgi:hypothetical protein